MKLFFTTILCFVIRVGFTQKSLKHFLATSDPTQPTLFAPNTISTYHYERDLALSPDGKEMYYSLVGTQSASVIIVRKYHNGTWGAPQIASFSGGWYDIEPTFSPDGQKLFFCSNRSLDSSEKAKDFDIWYVERINNGNWSVPKNMGLPINTSANEYYPSITKDGTLFFTATLKDGKGGEDIVYSKQQNGVYQKPVSLPEAINSKGGEFNAFIDPEEMFIIFGAEKRSDDIGGGDMYISFKKEGIWQPAQNLGKLINSTRLDYCPFISPDGKYFFFTSERIIKNEAKTSIYRDFIQQIDAPGNGRGDIYWIETSVLFSK